MLKLLKGLDQPPTIINTELIKFIQCERIGESIRLFMNEGFSGPNTTRNAGIILDVDYNKEKYESEADVMEVFLIFLNRPEAITDEFGICQINPYNPFKR